MIDETLTEPLTTPGLTKQNFKSESKLKEAFRNQYGLTIYQYILDRRMDKTLELFAEKSYRVRDAAWFLGYSNIGHFSAASRKKFGCTPK